MSQRQVFLVMLQLDVQHRRLNCIQTAADTDVSVMIAFALPVHSHGAHFLGERVIIGEDRTAVAEASQRFGGEEAGAADVAQGARFFAFIGCPKALRRIFDDDKAVFGSDGVDCIHVGGLPVEADGDDGLGLGGNFVFDLGGIDVIRRFVDIDEDRNSSQMGDHLGSGDKGERRRDYFVSWSDIDGHKRELQRIGSAGTGDGMLDADIGCEGAFEMRDLFAHDEVALVHDGVDCRIDFVFVEEVVFLEVGKIDGHASSLSWSFSRI